jgi:hypothetical protein
MSLEFYPLKCERERERKRERERERCLPSSIGVIVPLHLAE